MTGKFDLTHDAQVSVIQAFFEYRSKLIFRISKAFILVRTIPCPAATETSADELNR
jgi:hypothetical protein